MKTGKTRPQSLEPKLPYKGFSVDLPNIAVSQLSHIDRSGDGAIGAIEVIRGMIQSTNHFAIGKLFTTAIPYNGRQASALFSIMPPAQQATLVPMLAHSASTNLLMSLVPQPASDDYRDISYLLKELSVVDGNARFCGYLLYTLQKTNPGLDTRIIDGLPYNLGVTSGGSDVRAFFGACRTFNEHLKALRSNGLEDVVHYPSAVEAVEYANSSNLPLHGASFQTIDDFGFYFPMSEGLTILILQDHQSRRYGITIPDAIGYGGRFQTTHTQPKLSTPVINLTPLPDKDNSEPVYSGNMFYGDSPEMAGPISQTLMDSHSTASLEDLGHIRASQETILGYEASLTIFQEILRRDPSRKDIYPILDKLKKAINDIRSP